MPNRALEEYLNCIDYTTLSDSDIIANVYKEIGNEGPQLAVNPFTSTNLEKLVMVSNSAELVKFLKTFDEKLCYKKLGSRIIESIFKRLFDCMFTKNEYFSFAEVFEIIIPEKCINCRSATHVLRAAISLLTGKKVEKTSIIKYNIIDKQNTMDHSKSNLDKNIEDQIDQSIGNKEYSKKLIEEYKQKLAKCIHKLEEPDAFATFTLFLQCTKSQSLTQKLIEEYCNFENIKLNSHSYEAISEIASQKNLELIYNKIKDQIMEIALCEKSNYFLQSFIRNFKKPGLIYPLIQLNEFDSNSNVILSLLESLQRNGEFKLCSFLIKNFYNCEKNLFQEFLLSRHETLDTKYSEAIVNFMKMPERFNFKVNEDFMKYFEKSWLKSKTGRSLIIGFAQGSCKSSEKIAFFNKNIDLFWNCTKWKDGRAFAKALTHYTTEHSRKKAFEILESFN